MISTLLCVVSVIVAQPVETYRWPLDLPRELSSSFAEYRTGRFHAGIDLRTSGSGRPVHAVRAGTVTRVRCSPWGYGKAVYLKLDDGNTALFAHLSDYMPELADYVRQNQHTQKSYAVDLYPQPGQFRVEQGQVVAYSGQTGIGAPHLHYELRDSAERPINPRSVGITWPDDTRPVIHSVLVAPQESDGLLDNDVFPRVVQVENAGGGVYRTSPLEISGGLGFALSVTDPGPGGHKLGIWRMRLLLDGVEQFRMQHDDLSYDNLKNGVVAYHPFFSDEGQFLLACRWPGNVCSSYAHSAGDGFISLPTGVTKATATLEVTDYHDNTSRVEIPLRAGTTPVSTPENATSGQPGKASLDCTGNSLILSVQFPDSESVLPECSAIGPRGDVTLPVQRVGQRTFRCVWQPEQGGAYDLVVTHPRVATWSEKIYAFKRGAAGTAEMDDVTIHVQADTPYGYLFARVTQSPESRATGMTRLGKVYRVWPVDSPIDAPATISFPVPEGIEQAQRVHVYRMRGSGWSRQNTSRRGDRLEIETQSFGTFAVMEDKTPPALSDVLPTNNYTAQTRRPYVRAKISDNGSGVDNITVTCGGQWLLVSYDPEHNQIEWARDEDLPRGPQQILFHITDAAGNILELRRDVVIP